MLPFIKTEKKRRELHELRRKSFQRETKKAASCKNHDDLSKLSSILKMSVVSEAYLEPSRTCMMKFFAKIVESRQLFLQKSSTIDAPLSSKYGFVFTLFQPLVSLKYFTSFTLVDTLKNLQK